ncbi:tricarballylate utilization 4Fe-4S protein TcuB [Acuticoccus sp. I52.16.1]|uniref:tricarballylate utilization 4Fe-4S protein TcuB n=1 Tax=Acuticoccus sp. I52.16.1 TaxID=2928472 RepID=UPI002110F059|nr:tricarballylate utilization 4Fe-4S protein TcuB [Acuticoccus sp. I52.16.1]
MSATEIGVATEIAGSVATHATPDLAEADRLMTVCNACRYCEGLCAVFPAMERRRVFADGDLDYLANLCHNCGACWYDCQFAPPHPFAVHVPATLARVRTGSYARTAWPGAFAGVFARNGLFVAVMLAAAVAAFVAGFVAWSDPAVLFGAHSGPGAFYRLMPHNAMVALFGAAFLYALVAMVMGARQFWRSSGGAGGDGAAFRQAVRDAVRLRYLDGGGAGCSDRPPDRRRLFHHLTSGGFLLCLASTATATLYHYVLGREAPYGWFELPVVLGTLGGLGLVVGPLGLFVAKSERGAGLKEGTPRGMDAAFLAMLLATGLTGLALLVLRATPAMGLLLAVHLGVVFALFVTMPYGKFVHGLYRVLALVRSAAEERADPR